MRATGLAAVTSGRSGTIATTIGAVTVTVTAPPRASAVEVVRELARASQRVHGGSWWWWVTASGHLAIDASAAFVVAATGDCAALTGFTGTYPAAAAHEAAVAHDGGVYPTGGVGGSPGGTMRPRGAALGGGAATLGADAWNRVAVTLEGEHDELVAVVDELVAGTTWDVVCDGTVVGRVRVDGAPSLLLRGRRLDVAVLTVDAQEVTS